MAKATWLILFFLTVMVAGWYVFEAQPEKQPEVAPKQVQAEKSDSSLRVENQNTLERSQLPTRSPLESTGGEDSPGGLEQNIPSAQNSRRLETQARLKPRSPMQVNSDLAPVPGPNEPGNLPNEDFEPLPQPSQWQEELEFYDDNAAAELTPPPDDYASGDYPQYVPEDEPVTLPPVEDGQLPVEEGEYLQLDE